MSDPKLVEMKGPWHQRPMLDRLVLGARGKRAGDFHDACEIILKRAGWAVIREYSVPGGRVDIVAYSNGIVLALELDNRRPRKGSIEKLTALPSHWITGVLLRNPK